VARGDKEEGNINEDIAIKVTHSDESGINA
jgi:hypothetical protein